MRKKEWFAVDTEGMAKLYSARPKVFVLYELLQNAWDQEVTKVNVTFEPIPDQPLARIVVEDDDPAGFIDLTHTFTLYAESPKKADPEKRGRFNLGEKLVLALCKDAKILTTTGGVAFDENGRHRLRKGRPIGSEFQGVLRITRDELTEALAALDSLLPPPNIETFINGRKLEAREPIKCFSATLSTVIADESGALHRSRRKTEIRIFEPKSGEKALIYEMGIPVVETGDRWHVDIAQKVPLNTDRDNVPPAFLRELRTIVLNEMYSEIDTEEANAPWILEAFADESVRNEAIQAVLTRRFGEKRVIHDPSDPEANNVAVSKGYQVIHGNQFKKEQWKNIRRAGAASPAGQVTPSEKPYHKGGRPEAIIPDDEWTPEMIRTAAYAKRLARALIGAEISVKMVNEPNITWSANYGPKRLTLNASLLSGDWFSKVASVEMNELMIHEFGHHYSDNHLSSEYYDALCRLGARMTALALKNPRLFEDVAEASTSEP